MIYFLFRNPTPETKIAIPDANKTESKPLSSHSVTKYAIKDTSDTNQSIFKYFIKLI
jgi:hypothetical protein